MLFFSGAHTHQDLRENDLPKEVTSLWPPVSYSFQNFLNSVIVPEKDFLQNAIFHVVPECMNYYRFTGFYTAQNHHFLFIELTGSSHHSLKMQMVISFSFILKGWTQASCSGK